MRKECGMTQQQLAEQIGAKQNTVSGWETGVITPRVDKLKAMAELFGCTVDELLKSDE